MSSMTFAIAHSVLFQTPLLLMLSILHQNPLALHYRGLEVLSLDYHSGFIGAFTDLGGKVKTLLSIKSWILPSTMKQSSTEYESMMKVVFGIIYSPNLLGTSWL